VGPRALMDTVVKRKIPIPAGNRILEPRLSSSYPGVIPTELSRLSYSIWYVTLSHLCTENNMATLSSPIKQTAVSDRVPKMEGCIFVL